MLVILLNYASTIFTELRAKTGWYIPRPMLVWSLRRTRRARDAVVWSRRGTHINTYFKTLPHRVSREFNWKCFTFLNYFLNIIYKICMRWIYTFIHKLIGVLCHSRICPIGFEPVKKRFRRIWSPPFLKSLKNMKFT